MQPEQYRVLAKVCQNELTLNVSDEGRRRVRREETAVAVGSGGGVASFRTLTEDGTLVRLG